MDNKGHLEVIEDRERELEIIESLIRKQASVNEPLRILEAGCGKRWPFRLEGIQYILTGVDKDKEALRIRKNTLADLHEEIEGDLSSVDLGIERFDVIYCSYVLEHIKRADLVMMNFIKWARPNGIIIIKVPDPYSVKGFITRITPYWFHLLFYRFILGQNKAGQPGYSPYKTYYNPVISRSGMRYFCKDEKNSVVLIAEYGDGHAKPGRGGVKGLLYVLRMIISNISLGKLSYKHVNLLYIIRKQNA